MLSGFGEGLNKVKASQRVRSGGGTYQVPSLALDGLKFFLTHNGKDTFWGAGRGMKLEVQRENIGGSVTEVVEAEKELVDDLERIVAGSEGKYCV